MSPSKLSSLDWSTPLAKEKQMVFGPQDRITGPQVVLDNFVGSLLFCLWTKTKKRDAMSIKVKKFSELVKEGKSITEAANTVQETPRAIKSARQKFEDKVQQTLDTYFMPVELKKAWIRAKQTEIVDLSMEAAAADPSDMKALKIALEALKTIGDDVEVGMYQAKLMVAPSPPMPPQLAGGLAQLVIEDGAVPKEKND